MSKVLGVPKVVKIDTQCWHGKMTGHAEDRCPEYGNWGWTKAAADKAGAAKGSVFRRSRWCLAHKHYDDSQLEDSNAKDHPGSVTDPTVTEPPAPR